MSLLSGNEILGPAYRMRCHSFGVWKILTADVPRHATGSPDFKSKRKWRHSDRLFAREARVRNSCWR